MGLTQRQQEVLSFIQSAQQATGIVPSTREIQQHFGFASQTAAMNHLRALEKRGAIRRQAGKARAVSVVNPKSRQRVVDVPFRGSIAAGVAQEAPEETGSRISIDAMTAGITGRAGVFALRVRGDSMINAQIADGDIVIVEARQPRPGEIVAALVDGETTLKRYVVEEGKPVLRAENQDFVDIHPTQELRVQGVMVSLIRRMRNA